MSWADVKSPHTGFSEQAAGSPAYVGEPEWILHIWEITEECPKGHWLVESSAGYLHNSASLRIIFAPPDLPRRDALPQMLELFQILDIPGDFSAERTSSVSHSFARRTDEDGSRSWFHFLCKNVNVRYDEENKPQMDNRAVALGYHAPALPMADYTWLRSGFFLRTQGESSVTLVCFGTTPMVRKRLEDLIAGQSWKDIWTDPYILFDLVLDGLYQDVDEGIWNMSALFGPLEHSILDLANTKGVRRMSAKVDFVGLHNCAKQIIYFNEALESCLMVVDATWRYIGSKHAACDSARADLVQRQLRERLDYRKSLFGSTKLRLGSLQKRIDNILTLSFNLVTQQDSMVMTQDSSSMKIIAAITMIFLPTTGVATVIGSQLFVSERVADDARMVWDVYATPLFYIALWISIPLTLFVVVLAMLWTWWKRVENPHGEMVRTVRRVATFGTMGKT